MNSDATPSKKYPNLEDIMQGYFHQDAMESVRYKTDKTTLLRIEVIGRNFREILNGWDKSTLLDLSHEIRNFLTEYPDEQSAKHAVESLEPGYNFYTDSDIYALLKDVKFVIDRQFTDDEEFAKEWPNFK